jgi:hypothetical protein
MKNIRISITTQKWYHRFFDYISRIILSRRKPERDVTLILEIKFTKDWKLVKVENLYFNENSENLAHKAGGDNETKSKKSDRRKKERD